jgi:hypothetical protein
MRHLGSIVLALVLTPVIYLLTGIGMLKIIPAEGHFKVASLIGVAAILGAGALYALLVQARLSPLGPIIAGLALMVATVWVLVSPDGLIKLLPDSVLGVRSAGIAPLDGVALLLAVPLLITVVSPRRWRRYAQPRAAAGPAPGAPGGYPPPPPSGYQPSGFPAPGASGYSPSAVSPTSDPGPGYPSSSPAPASPAPSSSSQTSSPSYGQSNYGQSNYGQSNYGQQASFGQAASTLGQSSGGYPPGPSPLWPGGPTSGSSSDPTPTRRAPSHDDPEADETRRL